MARGIVDSPELTRLRERVEKTGSCGATASELGLERTLVWRAFAGHSVSRASCRRIREALDRDAPENRSRFAGYPQMQQIDVAMLRSTLHYLLRAVDALDEARRE